MLHYVDTTAAGLKYRLEDMHLNGRPAVEEEVFRPFI